MNLPVSSGEQLAVYVGHCTINPTAHLPFDVEQLPPAEKGPQKVLIVGGGIAGIQAAITAADRGHKVTLAEKSDKLGGLLYFTDVDIDKPDLRNFKDMMIREVKRHDVEILMNTGRKIMNVAVVGCGAISDIYLENMIYRFDNLNVIACSRFSYKSNCSVILG